MIRDYSYDIQANQAEYEDAVDNVSDVLPSWVDCRETTPDAFCRYIMSLYFELYHPDPEEPFRIRERPDVHWAAAAYLRQMDDLFWRAVDSDESRMLKVIAAEIPNNGRFICWCLALCSGPIPSVTVSVNPATLHVELGNVTSSRYFNIVRSSGPVDPSVPLDTKPVQRPEFTENCTPCGLSFDRLKQYNSARSKIRLQLTDLGTLQLFKAGATVLHFWSDQKYTLRRFKSRTTAQSYLDNTEQLRKHGYMLSVPEMCIIYINGSIEGIPESFRISDSGAYYTLSPAGPCCFYGIPKSVSTPANVIKYLFGIAITPMGLGIHFTDTNQLISVENSSMDQNDILFDLNQVPDDPAFRRHLAHLQVDIDQRFMSRYYLIMSHIKA